MTGKFLHFSILFWTILKIICFPMNSVISCEVLNSYLVLNEQINQNRPTSSKWISTCLFLWRIFTPDLLMLALKFSLYFDTFYSLSLFIGAFVVFTSKWCCPALSGKNICLLFCRLFLAQFNGYWNSFLQFHMFTCPWNVYMDYLTIGWPYGFKQIHLNLCR